MDVNLKSEPEITRSKDHYDSWLLALEPAFAHDLKEKLKVIAGEPGDSCAQRSIADPSASLMCPEVISAPAVRAVGDVHVVNFGTWPCGKGDLRWA